MTYETTSIQGCSFQLKNEKHYEDTKEEMSMGVRVWAHAIHIALNWGAIVITVLQLVFSK